MNDSTNKAKKIDTSNVPTGVKLEGTITVQATDGNTYTFNGLMLSSDAQEELGVKGSSMAYLLANNKVKGVRLGGTFLLIDGASLEAYKQEKASKDAQEQEKAETRKREQEDKQERATLAHDLVLAGNKTPEKVLATLDIDTLKMLHRNMTASVS